MLCCPIFIIGQSVRVIATSGYPYHVMEAPGGKEQTTKQQQNTYVYIL